MTTVAVGLTCVGNGVLVDISGVSDGEGENVAGIAYPLPHPDRMKAVITAKKQIRQKFIFRNNSSKDLSLAA